MLSPPLDPIPFLFPYLLSSPLLSRGNVKEYHFYNQYKPKWNFTRQITFHFCFRIKNMFSYFQVKHENRNLTARVF